MKKTLSILLSLLMVLSTVTCLFTMPVSAEEAATETTTVETLPVTDLFKDSGAVKGGTITPDSTIKLNAEYPTSAAYSVNGWNLKEDEEGNVISGQQDSYLDVKVLYQLTFNVTVSADVNEGVKLYPVFHSNATTNWSFDKIVGMRNEVGSGVTETAYNYKTGIVGCANDATAEVKATSSITAANAAALVPGKTYTYTYLFSLGSGVGWINYVRIFADGLTAGSVTVGDAKVFPYNDTYAANFYAKDKQVIYYMAEEDGNVFTRMYGYRDVDSTATTKYSVSAKVGGDLYNIVLAGGKTYNLNFDMRVSSTEGTALSYAPAFDLFETGALAYNTEYDEIRVEGDTTEYNVAADFTQSQRDYSAPNNGYSYFWGNSGSATRNRRPGATARMDYYNANGASAWGGTEGGSAQGRNAKDAVNNKGWLNGKYSLNAIGAQTIQEAAIAGAKANANSDSVMRYRYVDGAWVFNSAVNNYYVSAVQDPTVALGIEYIFAGVTYDLDNLTLISVGESVPVEYVNAAGEAVTVSDTVHPATTSTDVLTGETNVDIKLFESDMYTFKGWYNGDELVSTDATTVLTGTYDNLKAVVTVNATNILTNAGGFENYANNTNLEAAYTEVSKGCAKYPNYTGGTFRYYNQVPPTGDKWTGWDGNTKTTTITDSDSGVTKAQIIADIEAAGGMITSTGTTAFTYFKSFPQIAEAKNVTIFPDAGAAYGASSHYVTPYSGTKMLQMQASTRTGFRALEGLTAGKTYTLSMYIYNPYAYYFLKDVFIQTAPNRASGSYTQLAGYTTPYDVVTEDVYNGSGVATSTTGIQKAKADYVQKWYKVELTFTATNTVAYLGVCNQHKGNTSGYTFIDELTLVEYDCKGNHRYDDYEDTDCNVCGEARVYPTAWDFENDSMENINIPSGATVVVKDAVDQPEKIGSKYLEYTSSGWNGLVINFPYEQGYKYKISYDFKIFQYGTGSTCNGIDHYIYKFDDGKYGCTGKYGMVDESELDEGFKTESYRQMAATVLNPASENIVTRYWEDGTVYEKVSCFTHARRGDNNFYGSVYTAEGATGMNAVFGPSEMWDGWQHFEIEVGNNNDYEGLVEFGLRPNDSGWVVGIDNFTVTRVAETVIDEANAATDGTYAFNIRARTTEKKQGLRFKSTIDLDSLNLTDGAKIVEYGTLAEKASDANAGYFLRREAANAANAKVVAGVAYSSEEGIDVRYALDETTNTLTYTGVLTGIGVKNYDVDFAVCGYAIVELADGTRTTVYDDVVTLSVYDAAQQIIADGTVAADVTIAQTVVDTYDAYIAATAE